MWGHVIQTVTAAKFVTRKQLLILPMQYMNVRVNNKIIFMLVFLYGYKHHSSCYYNNKRSQSTLNKQCEKMAAFDNFRNCSNLTAEQTEVIAFVSGVSGAVVPSCLQCSWCLLYLQYFQRQETEYVELL